MQISAKAASVLEPRPWAKKYYIHGKYDVDALRGVVDAISLCLEIPVASAKDEGSLQTNFHTWEACHRLGIDPTHSSLKPLFATLCAQISDAQISPSILGRVTSFGERDAVFMHMAHVLCHRRFSGVVGDVKSWEKMVSKRPEM